MQRPEMLATDEVILETTLIPMSAASFAAFMGVLSAPPEVVPEMVTLMKREAPWEGAGTQG